MKTNKGFAGLSILIIILVVLVVGGIYYKKNNSNSNSKYLYTDNIKILYPQIGSKIESGSDVEFKYEITKDITPYLESPDEPQIVISSGEDCGESFTYKKPKGIYIFKCKSFAEGYTGPFAITIIERAHSEQEQPLIASAQIEIVTPSVASDNINIKPLEIIPGGSVSSDNTIKVYVPVKNEPDQHVAATSISLDVKFSDGEIRSVPFSDFIYSFDDSTLVRFYPAITKGAGGAGLIGNRVGNTILHLEYKGIKKDIFINTILDATTPDDPISYKKIYNNSSTSLNDFRVMCKQKNGTLQEDSNQLSCTSTAGNYFISVNGH